MTDAEQAILSSSLQSIRAILDAAPDLSTEDTEDLYQYFKDLHTAAIEPWCKLVDILRARKGFDTNIETRRRQDAINLEDLFGTDSGLAQAPSDLEA